MTSARGERQPITLLVLPAPDPQRGAPHATRCSTVLLPLPRSRTAVTAAASATTGVFVLDDYDIVRRGLEELLGGTEDLAMVGEAATAAEALELIGQVRPDVALLDIVLPDGNGIDVCREVRSRHPEVICLLLTFHDDDEALLAAVMAGAAGYVTKQVQGTGIAESIRRAASGESLMDPAVTRRLLQRLRSAGEPEPGPRLRTEAPVARLSTRERQVLDMVADGMTNSTIASELSVAEGTVRTIVSVLFSKLSLERRARAGV